MPLTVITISNAPASLRGDLTKWMQEISTGVYVGNFNSKIREQLWERVKQSIGKGQASLSYSHNNELGYRFDNYQSQRLSVDYDGIQLVLYPIDNKEEACELSSGFSNASKFRKAKKFANRISNSQDQERAFIVLDIETDGLNNNLNNIIEIAAIKSCGDSLESVEFLVRAKSPLPENIVSLTGITDSMLETSGILITDAIDELLVFIEDLPIIGYNIEFDIGFINKALESYGKPNIFNKHYDLLRFVKKEKMFLNNYRLNTVLEEYEIYDKAPHRALADAKLIHSLANKVNGFLDFLNRIN